MKMLKLPLETKNPDRYCGPGSGAGNQSRTDDLVITNDVLYQLSHASIPTFLSTSLLYQTFFRLSRGFVKKISQIRAFCGESGNFTCLSPVGCGGEKFEGRFDGFAGCVAERHP